MKNSSLEKWRRRNPLKLKANRVVYCASRNGTLKRFPCEVCSNKKSEAHHPDYQYPDQIIWLCKKHHEKEHQGTILNELNLMSIDGKFLNKLTRLNRVDMYKSYVTNQLKRSVEIKHKRLEQIYRLMDRGLNQRQVAKKMRLSRQRINQILKRYPHPNPFTKNELMYTINT